jgi:hypothetical protein
LPLAAALVPDQALLFTRLKGHPVYQVTNYAKSKSRNLFFLIFGHKRSSFLSFGIAL